MKLNLKLELRAPYLPPILADEIRAEIAAMRPQVHLVMPAWRWLEVRGITQEQAAAIVAGLQARGVRFERVEGAKKRTKAQVQVSEVLTVD